MSKFVWQFVAVFLVAMNLRMTITGVGPLLDDIAASREASAATLGLLASIPLIAWAIVSPVAHSIAARFGMDRTITWALVLLAAGTIWRSLTFSPANLWFGTVLIGAALAIANVLMPAVVKRDFGSRTTAMMGVYSATLGGAAGIGTAIALPVARAEVSGIPLGWEAGLLASGWAIPFALVAWMLVSRFVNRAVPAAAPTRAVVDRHLAHAGLGTRVWRSKTAWLLALYMGTQSTSFYILATWIVPIQLSRGIDETLAGIGITLFHFCGMAGSLLTPIMLRFDGRSLLQVALPVMLFLGMSGLVFVPALVIAWLVLLGLCSGAALSVSLTLIAHRSPDTHTASAVSGMTQSVGYLIAALGPVLFGGAYDLTGEWILPLFVMGCALAVKFTVGWILRDGRMVRV
ncbi:MAG: MFS transporter [Leucobacter sp.]